MDVYPTLLDLCSLDVPEGADVKGRSFKPYLENPLDPIKDDRPLFFHYFNPKNFDEVKKTCVIWKNWRLLADVSLYDVKEDRIQKNDIAADHPEVVKQMQGFFSAHRAEGLDLIKEPVRFILGDKRAKIVDLTSQDIYRIGGGPQAFSQSHVRDLTQAHGPYKVTVATKGSYTITLSRYPLYTKLPFGIGGKKMNENDFAIEKVRLAIAGQTAEKEVTPEDTHASFTLDLEKGDTNLETWLIGDGKDGVAYFVTVEFNG
jgi:hypothetical protein